MKVSLQPIILLSYFTIFKVYPNRQVKGKLCAVELYLCLWCIRVVNVS